MCLKNASKKITLTPLRVVDYMKFLVSEQWCRYFTVFIMYV